MSVHPLRAVAFTCALYLNTLIYMVVFLPVLLLPRRVLWRAVASWAAVNHWLLRTICGIDFEIRGTEHIPDGPLLVAAKHQSAFETYTLLGLFADPTYVLKRELMWIPIFGWYCLKAGLIPVRRGARSTALAAMAKRAKIEIARKRQIIIFPEGTRRPPGAEPNYKYGVAYLYGELGVPCLPVALNSGLYWPRRSWRLRPGTIRIEVLPPIPPGMQQDAFLARLQNEIERTTDRLVSEGEGELAGWNQSVPSST